MCHNNQVNRVCPKHQRQLEKLYKKRAEIDRQISQLGGTPPLPFNFGQNNGNPFGGGNDINSLLPLLMSAMGGGGGQFGDPLMNGGLQNGMFGNQFGSPFGNQFGSPFGNPGLSNYGMNGCGHHHRPPMCYPPPVQRPCCCCSQTMGARNFLNGGITINNIYN